MGELAFVKLGVQALFLQKLCVLALLDDVTVLHHKDAIRFLNGRESMGNHEAGAAFH